jgi:hypothetical protein
VYKFWNKFNNKINHGFALTYNTLKKNNANEFGIKQIYHVSEGYLRKIPVS